MKKIIIILLILIVTGCENYAELNDLSVVTGAAIDKTQDGYELSFLIANSPKAETSSKEGEATTTVYSAKGKTIPDALKKISRKTPKQLYFSHINVVIISEEIGRDGFLKVADWFIRHPQTRNKFYLMQVNENKAKNVLKIVSPLESFPSQSIATLIKSNKNSRSVGDTASYSNFIGRIVETGYEPIMPTIKINGSAKEGSTKSNIETTEPKTYLSLGPLAIYKNDKLIATTTQKETEAIHILNNEAKEIIYKLKYKNENINIFSNTLKTKIKLKKDKININITGRGSITEAHGNVSLDSKDIYKLEHAWNKSLKKDTDKLINSLKTKYQSDIFGFGNLIYKNNPKKWEKLKNNWNEKGFKNLNVKINVKTKINSTGTLSKTIEGDIK